MMRRNYDFFMGVGFAGIQQQSLRAQVRMNVWQTDQLVDR